MIDIFWRSSGDMRSYAGLVVSLCREHGLSHWMACGRILEGWAAVNDGDVDHGIGLIRTGVAAGETREPGCGSHCFWRWKLKLAPREAASMPRLR
jgi:hypothetical protein